MLDDIVATFREAPRGALAGAELTLVRRFRHSPEKLWAALTIPARLEAWMGVEWLGDQAPLTPGGPFSYRFANTNMESRGRVLRLEAPRLLEHTWFENIPPGAEVRWSVEAEGGGSRLTLVQRFGAPDDGARNAAGWTEILRRLEAALDEAAPGGWSVDDWRILRDAFAERLGEAATRDARVTWSGERATLTFVRVLRHSPEAVWTMIIDPGALPRWMQATATLDAKVGGRFRLAFHGMDAVGEGEVTAFEPPHRFAFTWPEPVDLNLEPHPEGCRLTLTATVNAADAADNAGGWHWHLDALERALVGETVPRDAAPIEAIHKIYQATLRPGASS